MNGWVWDGLLGAFQGCLPVVATPAAEGDPPTEESAVPAVAAALAAMTPAGQHFISFVLDDPECPTGIVVKAFDHYGQTVTASDVAEHRKGL